jgi:hypothetical protein
MLLDQARSLSAKIGDYTRLKSNAGAAKEFETRSIQFGGACDKLLRTCQSIKRLREAGVTLDFVPKDGAALADKAAKLRSLLKEDPAKLNDPPFNLKYDFTDRLNAICSAADEVMLDAWEAHLGTHSETASSDVLTALSAIPQYRPVVARIMSVKDQIATLASRVPLDPAAALSQLNTLTDSYRTAWGGMTADGIPPAVIGFLRAAAGSGAALNQLTDEVRSWLEGRNLLHVFRIKI